jgi:hypothetical protein
VVSQRPVVTLQVSPFVQTTGEPISAQPGTHRPAAQIWPGLHSPSPAHGSLFGASPTSAVPASAALGVIDGPGSRVLQAPKSQYCSPPQSSSTRQRVFCVSATHAPLTH